MRLKAEQHDIADEHILSITTLGSFYATGNGVVISDKCSRSNKLWELFKFLLTNRGKPVPVEILYDLLWTDKEPNASSAALQTTVHRMRRLFYNEFPPDLNPFEITFSQGCYSLVLSDTCRLDCDVFLQLAREAREIGDNDPEEATRLYYRAAVLYRGEYLPECASQKWVLPAKRYYRIVYLQVLLSIIQLLMKSERYDEIYKICERAFQIEHFTEVEAIHLCFMEALYKNGRTREALCHYEFITTMLYHEYGAKPSTEMRELYRKMRADSDSAEPDLASIIDKLTERNSTEGACLCDREVFRFIYRLEVRRTERESSSVLLGLFGVTWDDYKHYSGVGQQRAMDALEKILIESLRKGDIVARWGDSQYLIMMPGVGRKDARLIFNRVESSFSKNEQFDGMSLSFDRQSSLPGAAPGS